MNMTPQFQSCSNHQTRDEAVSCYHFAAGAHGANHFQESGLSAVGSTQCETGVEVGQTSASDFSILHRPSIIRSADERQTRYAAALTCEGGGLDRFMERVDAVLDREMAEPSDFDHDSFAATEFARGLGGAR